MLGTTSFADVAQDKDEIRTFIGDFAMISIEVIKKRLMAEHALVAVVTQSVHPDWDDATKLQESGLTAAQVDDLTRKGLRYLHIDLAMSPAGADARRLFLDYTGLSDKQRGALFPALNSAIPASIGKADVSAEVRWLNGWLDWVRLDGFDPSAFIAYRKSVTTHGNTQNLSGAIGATGAAIAFIDAINEIRTGSIVEAVGELPPPSVRSPKDVYEWRKGGLNRTIKALLLDNGRAIVFASSKDANIFQPLGTAFTNAADALRRFNAVKDDVRARAQQLHEFAVGEVKTATDLANLHERMGLASRETQTELRTDRFLMMAVLNQEILSGGRQRRSLNNRDVRRFSHVFNLHHCWGYDGGRTRHPDHWNYFKASLQEWCGLP